MTLKKIVNENKFSKEELNKVAMFSFWKNCVVYPDLYLVKLNQSRSNVTKARENSKCLTAE